MFYDFLKVYIRDYIEASNVIYNITEDEIYEIAEDVSNNDYVWNILDEAITQKLDLFEEENDEESEES